MKRRILWISIILIAGFVLAVNFVFTRPDLDTRKLEQKLEKNFDLTSLKIGASWSSGMLYGPKNLEYVEIILTDPEVWEMMNRLEAKKFAEDIHEFIVEDGQWNCKQIDIYFKAVDGKYDYQYQFKE